MSESDLKFEGLSCALVVHWNHPSLCLYYSTGEGDFQDGKLYKITESALCKTQKYIIIYEKSVEHS